MKGYAKQDSQDDQARVAELGFSSSTPSSEEEREESASSSNGSDDSN